MLNIEFGREDKTLHISVPRIYKKKIVSSTKLIVVTYSTPLLKTSLLYIFCLNNNQIQNTKTNSF